MDHDSEKTYIENDNRKISRLELIFEKILWSTRFLVLFAVISSLAAALLLFIIGSKDIVEVVFEVIASFVEGRHTAEINNMVVGMIIGSVDIFLIAVVLLIFGLGLYELFISKIDHARKSESSNILNIKSLEVLKDKIAQVIIMALIVKYFQMILQLSKNFNNPLDMIYLAFSILALSGGLFLLNIAKNHLSQKDRPHL